jgi:hypothetical protein
VSSASTHDGRSLHCGWRSVLRPQGPQHRVEPSGHPLLDLLGAQPDECCLPARFADGKIVAMTDYIDTELITSALVP